MRLTMLDSAVAWPVLPLYRFTDWSDRDALLVWPALAAWIVWPIGLLDWHDTGFYINKNAGV
ncbi:MULTISPECIES: hypothetical protein [Bifidobacterium]|jgi:hypothetical protein|uniref:hypothetical protein n=1 Tax=Bifidobacterium TaxID=1678 RepID=UPI0011063DBA|nr:MULTISPECIES: hypothetical protein [Bifidobacterium]MDB6666497.1 hypothetical protein [Bifidobacterium longum]MDB6668826.1 hypothetical protein [Bifidobacterium longum]MDB6684075.1 hypothetical protein [Bifidobacterium longum]